jgi:hypothetical protein
MRRIILIYALIIFLSGYVSAQQKNVSTRYDSKGSIWIGAVAGPSLLIEKAPDSLVPQIQDYFNSLRSGWHYGFETEYFFNKYIGLGFKYNRFSSKQDADSIVVKFFSTILYIDLSNEINVHTLSPMVFGRLPLLHEKLSITGGIGPAWLLYRNIGKAVGDTAMFKGSSPGLSTSLFIGYEVFPNLNIGIQTSYIHAFLKEFTSDNGTTQEVIKLEEENYQNISRFDFSLGVFYTLRWKK